MWESWYDSPKLGENHVSVYIILIMFDIYMCKCAILYVVIMLAYDLKQEN